MDKQTPSFSIPVYVLFDYDDEHNTYTALAMSMQRLPLNEYALKLQSDYVGLELSVKKIDFFPNQLQLLSSLWDW